MQFAELRAGVTYYEKRRIYIRAAACGDRERVLNELRASAGRRLLPAQFFELHFLFSMQPFDVKRLRQKPPR